MGRYTALKLDLFKYHYRYFYLLGTDEDSFETIISSYYYFMDYLETVQGYTKKPSISLMSSENDLLRNQAIQNQKNSFSRGFPLLFNVETLQTFGALFQIPHYYRKCLHCKSKMLCNYVINTGYTIFIKGYQL
jgi:hypothetical protein